VSSGSALGNEIYRLDVESGAIQGLGIEYNAYLGDEPGDVPETVRSIDTNGDGSVLSGIASFQTASTLNMIYFRWTPSAGFVDMAPSGPWPDREPASVALSSHAETTIFGSGELPIIISTTPPSLASNQFGGIVLFPVSVSGDGTWYSIGGTHGTPGTVPSNCLRSFGGCWAANQPILDLNYDGHAGVGREYYGSSGLRYPVGSFYWTSTENVRYLHEALYDHGILLDVDILSRAAINADGRSVLGTATRRFSDGSSRNECFIAHFPDPVPPAPADEIVTGTAPDQALSAGGDTTCATGSDGSARCWGAGIAAMLGRAARDAWSALPTAPLQDAAQLALAPSHSCALLSDHSVQCWGNNGAGQLGDGTLLSSDVPVGVLGIDDAVQVAVAGGVSCAVREAFGLQCWGQSNGAPSSLPSARAVSLAGGGGCATLNDGTVTCWGAAEAFATDASEGPWPIPGLQNISQFEMAGYSSWCALSSNGVVTCSWPECCDQSTCPPEDPVALGGTVRAFSRPVTQISAGDTHFCALLDNGTVECAGYGGSGQLGARNRLFCAPTPVPVAGVTGVVQIAAGAHHTCALLDSGAVRCWGRDDVGQLGLGFVYTSHLASPPVFPLPNLSLFGSELPPGLSRPAYVRRAR
jgi:hypothetical protein